MNAIELGKFISQLRNEKNITQDELAELLNVNSGKTISKWECGNSLPDFDILIKLCDILDVTLFELSIGKRIEDPSILEKTKNKIKSLKDITKLKLKRKIILVIGIIIGIILGLSGIFTIKYFNQVHIYELDSLDEDFVIKGTFIEAKDYISFNLMSIGYVGNDKEKLNINAYKIEYEVYYNNKRFIYYKNTNSQNKTILHDDIISAHFIKPLTKDNIPNTNNLVFNISFFNEKNQKQNIDFNFQLVEKFQTI